jgi:hypothetical protein
MSKFRFSPIKSKEELMKAIEYTHFACFELCNKAFGRYLPVSGNIGIFSHFDDEFAFLTKIREELTDMNDNWNQKYFRLHNPITFPAKDDIPETTYTYLYVRRPDIEKSQVGDADLVLEKNIFSELKNQSLRGKQVNGVELFYRPDLDMIRLSSPEVDILPYITTRYMNENVKSK